MAKTTSLTFVCSFLLVLLLCSEFVFVEGRHLKKSGFCRKCSKSYMNARAHGSNTNQERTSKVEYGVDDFRPTEPGHSPGVGHSFKN
ncbi:Precursor of CEP3 [Quillaja saponaria]|uniref:Precursor of CEP3 n=1 Tax=Quillaja saponaria TaxID=32244 RepID=A0AAD7L7X7_QUISA|nr:Precursor of CEP3 [Quillaja saponaria]